MLTIHEADNLDVLRTLPDAQIDLVYIDPPFNTGHIQSRTQLRTTRDDAGDRIGYAGQRFRTERLGTRAYNDTFEDYPSFLEPRLIEAARVLSPTGSLFVHLDFREVHHVKVQLDRLLGRERFMNEIIWAYDYGGRARRRWSPKHDNILWYVMDPDQYIYNYDAIDRIPYMAPKLAGPEKAARGKTPTDTWWHTIVSPNGKEKTGYPTQKPLAIMERIVRVHSNAGHRLLDFFAGSGSLGEAAAMHGRDCVLVDSNPEAIAVMEARLVRFSPTVHRTSAS